MNSLSVFRFTNPSGFNIFLYRFKKTELVILCFVRLYLICGSGKVIQISSTSFSANAWSTNSIWVRRNATFEMFSSKAVFAPLQNRAPLISTPIKFLFGNFWANATEYSPFPQPNSKTIGLSFLKKVEFQLPFRAYTSFVNSSLVGWNTFLNVSFSLNLLSLFLLPTLQIYFG